ncbi:MAG: hypothetical protein ABIP20_16790 [Chthoniobacteraceae bacterium]
MTLPLLKSALEPVVRRQRFLRLTLCLAATWLVLAAVALFLWKSNVTGNGVIVSFVLAGVAAWMIVRRLVESWEPDYMAIARSVEQRHPDLHALLVTAVEQSPESSARGLNFLQQRVVADAVAEMRRRDCVETVPGWQIAGAFVLQFGMLALLVFSLTWLQDLIVKPTQESARAQTEEVSVTPGDTEIERGGGLIVLAKFARNLPSEAVLVLSPVNAPGKRIPLVKNLDDPVFGGGVPEVQGDLSYRVEYAGRATRDFHVKVFEHPRLDRADAIVHFPEFAKLPDKTIADTRRVSAVQGSVLDVSFQLNKPVQSAQLVAKDGTVVTLNVDPSRAVAELKDFPVKKSATWELMLKDADGRANKLAATFTLDALPNRRPELKIVTPKGDQRVSPIEEVAFRIEAWDDFGLRAAGISYSVGGGETKEITLARDSKPDERLQLEQLLKLESIGVKVDELVSWHAWAEDVGADGKLRRTQSDIFFAEVRPFEEIYRPGEESAGEPPPGGNGKEATELADLQKQIVTATWNLKRSEDSDAAPVPSEKYLKDEPVVKDSQAEALGMARKLAEKIEEPKSAALAANVMQEMERALGLLTAAEKAVAPLPDALAAEQAAYNALLKLAAHEFRVQKNQRGKGKGQQRGDRQRAQLDELEMKDEKKRYEKQSEAQQQSEQQKEQLVVLNRLKELAQRQQDINERVKELQNAMEEAKTEKEREEARRQLKRLREEEQQLLADADELKQKMEKAENQSRFAEERKQLEQTRNDAQQAAESMQKGESSRALAEGKRAEEGLKKMRDELRKKASGEFKDEMRQMRADARELAEKQMEISEQLDAKSQVKQRRTLEGGSPREKLAGEFEKQQKGLGDLREQMQRVSEQAEAAEPLLARQLYDTLRENAQTGTDETLKMAGELARRGMDAQTKQFEEKARGELEKVKSGVERAAESVLGDEAEALRQARAELDSLGKQLEREMANARPDLAENKEASRGKDGKSREGVDEKEATPGKDGTAKSPGGEAPDGKEKGDSQSGEGKKGDTQKADGQKGDSQRGEGEKGEGQQGRGQSGGEKGDAKDGEKAQGKGEKGEGQNGEGKGEKGDGQKGDSQKADGQKGQGRGEGKRGGKGGSGSKGESQNPQDGSPSSQAARGKDGAQAGGGAGGGKQSSNQQSGREPGKEQGGKASSGLAQLASSAGARNGGNNGGANGGGGLDGGPQFDQRAPLTGDGFVDWSDRLRNVEEMLDSQQLRREVAEIREAAKVMRSEFKREGAQPKWDIVKSQISKPLTELRNRVSEELARRESKESLVPIDRDPVPVKYSERVRKYYEELGRSR